MQPAQVQTLSTNAPSLNRMTVAEYTPGAGAPSDLSDLSDLSGGSFARRLNRVKKQGFFLPCLKILQFDNQFPAGQPVELEGVTGL